MSAVNVKKSLLALILAVLLVASMLPLLTYNAAAATFYSVTGIVNDATTNTITIMKNGKYRTFGKMDAKILRAQNGIALGDTVQIVYNAANPKDAVQITMISHTESAHRRPHETHTLQTITGVVNDAGMSTITITTRDGNFTFSKEDAQLFNVHDGILLGDKVRIAYYDDNPSIAVKLIMLSHGSAHRTYDSSAPNVNGQFIGEVLAVGDDEYFTCQNVDTGITYTFYYHPSYYDDFTLEVGDVILIIIDRDHPSTALRVIEQNR